jgi:preprotein translocase subunit SecG
MIMLSFLQEQNSGELPAQKANGGGAEAPSGANKSEDQEYLTVAEHGKRTRRSTVVLAVLFITGLCCLWFMIKKSTPQAASAGVEDAEEVELESAIERLTGVKTEVFGRMDQIVNKFYEFSDVLQVQVGELVKNPFRLELFLDGVKEDSEANNTAPDIDVEELWKQQIRQKAEDLQLSSIMQSDSDNGSCCMVGSNILYEGDSVEGFKVTEIGDDFIKLEWESKADDMRFGGQVKRMEVILKMSQ